MKLTFKETVMKIYTLLLLFFVTGLASVSAQTKDLVLIDESIQNVNVLKDATLRDAKTLMVNEESEIWFEIYREICSNKDIKQVHLLLPTKDGKLVLNGKTYDQHSICEIFDLRLLKNKDISLIFYGSGLAEVEEGKALINKIAELTNLNVAASTTPTAGENKGGDWGLEYQTNTAMVIEPLFNKEKLKDYPRNF